MDERGLGQRLQEARLHAGMTQQTLCQKADLSYSTLTKIERGAIKSPSIFTIQRIAEVLGVGLDSLLGTAPLPARSASKKVRSKSGVTFVYFDINGCLVRFFHAAFTRLSSDTGLTPDVIESAFWRYNDQVCRGEMSLSEFNDAFAKEIGTDSLDWQSYYMDAIEVIPAMQDFVAWTAKHYRVGLLTNIMPGFIAYMQKHKLLPDIAYDVIIDSSKVGAIKPEAKIFELAAEKAGCPDKEILFVDDSRTNLMAAGKRGWHVLWFDDYNPEESIERIRDTLAFDED